MKFGQFGIFGSLLAVAIVACSVPPSHGDMCAQTEEAAHYIASKSNSASDVARVTREVIADRKYPILGDKVVASIGVVVALKYGTETPDGIAAGLRDTCLKRLDGR